MYLYKGQRRGRLERLRRLECLLNARKRLLNSQVFCLYLYLHHNRQVKPQPVIL
ncbi:MAG: hypothetical protein NW226_09830 [Microscillaceae bacterium]|nr:hypothetical protein [Microscillaceae bacterium]